MDAGDIILVRDGKSFVALGIQFFLRIYKRKRDIPVKEKYHHAGTIIRYNNKLHVAEANAKGYQIQPLYDAYKLSTWNKRIDVKTPVVPYSESEKEEISALAISYTLKVNKYDYLNFLFQIWFIFTGKWIGPKGKKAENRFYCSEAVATLANLVRPNTFKNPHATNPVDVAINPHYFKSYV